ncbi:hypothetical protein [Mesorhizobium sp. WSM3224]|uniref:alpha/beta hydrolase family protein n=1 Tax=Mesorhizobium sp. WSM3224 TaxID=1040986 RepID=UPI000489B0CC|nr:hypothetical protein [Mesorhizobium sp. WSM3224]
MCRLSLPFAVVVWLVSVFSPVFAADFTKPGPFAIGLQKFTIPDTSGKHPMATMVWYPAAGPAPDPNGAILKVSIDAPAATTGPYPLVILIHGLDGNGSLYGALGRQLASYGFVVAAADYDTGLRGPLDEGVSREDQWAIWLLYDHPADVIRVIGYADLLTAPGGRLAGLIDTSRIGVWGHSSGGTTVFQAGGARVNFKELDAWCAVNKNEPSANDTCQFVGHEQSVATQYGVADPFAAPMPPIWDKRVAALVAGAPGGDLHALGETGIAEVNVPTLIMFATDDASVLPKHNALWAYDQISSQDKALAVFDSGGHMMFMNSKQANALTTAFLLDILKGRPAGGHALLPDAVSFPGLSYQTTVR